MPLTRPRKTFDLVNTRALRIERFNPDEAEPFADAEDGAWRKLTCRERFLV